VARSKHPPLVHFAQVVGPPLMVQTPVVGAGLHESWSVALHRKGEATDVAAQPGSARLDHRCALKSCALTERARTAVSKEEETLVGPRAEPGVAAQSRHSQARQARMLLHDSVIGN
jgi:hypothetical protein